MKTTILMLYLGFGILFNPHFSNANEGAPQRDNSTEEILFEPIETIITASKREQRIQDSPSTISVITEEDIQEYGAASIPDVLKYVPGIDVMEITSSHWEVSSRGLNQLRSNKMLVLIDGRSVYFDYFGGLIWEALPIQIDDIRRIEVIRGPVSALYGANAFSGVINIITKTPREAAGTHVGLTGGNLSNYRASIIHGGRKGKLGYKISEHERNINSWRNRSNNSERRNVGNVKLDYLINGKSSMSLDAGVESGSVEQIILASILRFEGTTGYLKYNYDFYDAKFQFFWNHGNISSPSFVNYGSRTEIKYNTVDAEMQKTLLLGSLNTLTFEGNYRINTIESTIIDDYHQQNLAAGFIQNEFRPSRKLSILLGLRGDHHPLVRNNLSPRGSIIFEPVQNHTFRFSVGKAFRSPSFTDSYLFQPLQPVFLPSPPFPQNSKTEITIMGNEKLKPERIQAYEIGYQTFLRHKSRLKIDLFYNKVNDFIGTGDFIPISFLIDDRTGLPILVPVTKIPIPSKLIQSFVNLGSADAYGGELDVEVLLNSWLRLRGNYSSTQFENRYTLNRYQAPPRNKFNVIADFTFRQRISVDLFAHYVDQTRWDIDTDNNSIPEEHLMPSYFVADSRFAYKISDTNAQVVFVGQNIFNNIHKEYPIGESIGRKISLSLNYKF